MYGWEERGALSQALHDGVELENTWLDGWEGWSLASLRDNFEFENTQLDGCIDEMGGQLLALDDDLGLENIQLDGCMDEMRGLVTREL